MLRLDDRTKGKAWMKRGNNEGNPLPARGRWGGTERKETAKGRNNMGIAVHENHFAKKRGVGK